MQKMNFPWQNGRAVSPVPWLHNNDDAASAAPTRETTPAPWTVQPAPVVQPAPWTVQPAPIIQPAPELPAIPEAQELPEAPARPIHKRVRQPAPAPRVIPGVVARLIAPGATRPMPQERTEKTEKSVQREKQEKREKPAKPVAQIHLFPLEQDMQGCTVYRARLRRGGDPRVLSDLRLGDTIFTPEPRRIGFVGRAGYFSPGRKITSVVLGLL